jgi:hypothetical protein
VTIPQGIVVPVPTVVSSLTIRPMRSPRADPRNSGRLIALSCSSFRRDEHHLRAVLEGAQVHDAEREILLRRARVFCQPHALVRGVVHRREGQRRAGVGADLPHDVAAEHRAVPEERALELANEFRVDRVAARGRRQALRPVFLGHPLFLIAEILVPERLEPVLRELDRVVALLEIDAGALAGGDHLGRDQIRRRHLRQHPPAHGEIAVLTAAAERVFTFARLTGFADFARLARVRLRATAL